jgi:RNA polymerase sigma-70 factor (ECF subfamily)
MIATETRGAWRELEARLRPYVARRVPSPADVDDVLQEVFVRMQRGLGDLRDGERFGGWVYRIAAHAIADSARARARHPLPVQAPDAATAALTEPAPEDDDAEGFESALGQCAALFVARLPSPYREAVTLTDLEGVSQKEAAEMLGVSVSGMKSRVQRGREKIRAMFEECCEISLDCRGHVVQCEPRARVGACDVTLAPSSETDSSPPPRRAFARR